MQTHENFIVVAQDVIDERGHVNNVRYVEWVQDIAQSHWEMKTNPKTRDEFYWILVSHHIQYKAEALLGDVLRLKTYVKKSEGVRSTRIVEVYNKNTDKLLTTSETIWCFMSHENNKPARIPEDIIQLFS
ncbi:acyl-CoA thioesterase [Psychroserpens sp. Hel_I_66]|uniref:acyl-CoA thioesterase n=1 Tax=Psychroserpens sp. Hel_I_66 TaxID=1250004 RepID=UPI0006456311